MLDLQALNRESLVQLTALGRKSGKPHTVKIWFAARVKGKCTSLPPVATDAQWVKNSTKNPQVSLQIADTSFKGTAVWREDDQVRTEVIPLFLRKYFLAKVFKWIGWYQQIFAFEITPKNVRRKMHPPPANYVLKLTTKGEIRNRLTSIHQHHLFTKHL